VAILPLIGYLGRVMFRSQESSYLLPVIFISIHIPVLLVQGLLWNWGHYLWEDMPYKAALWNQTTAFILFLLVFRAALMNKRSTAQPEQFRLMLTTMAILAFIYMIPGYFGPYYLTAPYISDDTERMSDEELFSTQSVLLENEYKNLRQSPPGKTDIFTITYGGYGYQQVFKREALFARKQIDHALGSSQRSVALANHRTTRKTLPMADLSNLYSVTGEMAQRAQTDEDILVLYITSHGGQNGEISTDMSGTELMEVDARNLHKMLKESGFRWKVVIVSACYSGSFIPVMKSDDTLIITAASATRTSFGCSDNADLTYFGEAFLKDALPKAKNFEDAFKKAKAIIESREKAENITASDPQISMGKNIRAKLSEIKFNTSR